MRHVILIGCCALFATLLSAQSAIIFFSIFKAERGDLIIPAATATCGWAA